MSTSIQAVQTTSPESTTRTSLPMIPVCDCGQDLDCCGGSHCPRCGCTVRVLRAAA